MNKKDIKQFLSDAKAVSPAIATLILIVVAAVAAAGIGILVSHSQGSSKEMLDTKTASVQGKIVSDGSTTVLPVTLAAAPAFMTENPSYSISASGGGSNVGMIDVFTKKVDIGASSAKWPDTDTIVPGYSVPIPARSKAVIQEAGQGATVWETAIGTGMIVIAYNIPEVTGKLQVVNDTATCTDACISFTDLKNIYMGIAATNATVQAWGLKPVQRSDQSGTEDTFSAWFGAQDSGTKQLNSSITATGAQGNQGIKEYIAATPHSIGFVDVSFADGTIVKAATMDNVQANSDTKGVNKAYDTHSKYANNDAKHGLARDLYYYTYGTPTGAVKAYLDYILSSAGQDAVHNAGFFSIS
jgi:phosphate transport system substrate-binding protein